MANVNQLESVSHLPPRKRILAGYKKQNPEMVNGGSRSFASSSSTTTSNGSSSALTNVQTHIDNILASQRNDLSQTPEELARSCKEFSAIAAKAAKAARAKANETAIIASKAVAAAKSALALVASFPVEVKEMSPMMNKQKKKHVPVQQLYSKGFEVEEDLARRLSRAINSSSRVSMDCSGHKNKKQRSLVTYENSSVTTSTMYDGHDVAGVVDSDSSDDEDVDRTRVKEKLILSDNAPKEKTGEESSSFGKRRIRVKIKKLPLSMGASKDQENGTTKSPIAENNVSVSKPLAQSEGSVAQVIAGPSMKCQELKSPECVRS